MTNVRIITDNEDEDGTIKVHGVFGVTPIHLKDKDNDPKITQDNLYIDVCATSKDEVLKMGIEVGNNVVFDTELNIIDEKYLKGKSLDDKIGGYIIAEVLKKIVEEKISLPYDLYVVNSVQEEVGLRGAKMISETIKPDVAICFDVHFDTSTPNIDKSIHGSTKMGEGLIFRGGYDVHSNLLKLMKKVATDTDTDFKVIVGGSGGTNTAAYNLANGGVVTSTISIPLRYMHTPQEIVKISDVELTINYMVELLQNIKNKHDFKWKL